MKKVILMLVLVSSQFAVAKLVPYITIEQGRQNSKTITQTFRLENGNKIEIATEITAEKCVSSLRVNQQEFEKMTQAAYAAVDSGIENKQLTEQNAEYMKLLSAHGQCPE